MKLRKAQPSPDASIFEFEQQFVRPKAGRTLIVGSQVYHDKEDRRLRYPDAVGVDMLDGDGVDRVLNLEDPLPDDLGLFDHIECMSVLEHSRRPWLLAANLERLLVPRGTIYVTVPFMWRMHAYPDDFWRMTPQGMMSVFPGIDWQTVMYAGDRLYCERDKLETIKNPHPFYPRTEVAGFGLLA